MDFAASDALVGREKELAALSALTERLAAGRGGLAWIEGEPGIGKSALVDALADGAAGAGCLVLRAAADELMEAFPLRLMAECLGVSARPADPGRAEIAGLLRGEATVSGAADPVLAAGERMLELVDRMCASSPVVLVAEDLHWADEPSLLIWSRLARAVDQIPLLLVATTRPVPRRETLDRLLDLVEKQDGTVVQLGPLGDRDAAALAARIADGEPGPRLAEALHRAGGNPLYLRELVDALMRDGLVTAGGGSAELDVGSGATPASLTVAIGRRLGFLTQETRKALRIAALLGNDADAAEWALVTDYPLGQLAELIADAVACGVLRETGGRLRFRHELIREVLVEQTPLTLRWALHSAAARKLAEAGRGVDAVARHLLAVPGAAEDWALGWLARLGEAATYAAPQVSAELLERAVRSTGPADPRWEPLATRLAQVLYWLGRDEAAFAVSGEVARAAQDPVLACRMRIQMIRVAGRLGRFEDALAAAVRPEDDRLPPMWHARLSAWSALILHYCGRGADSIATARGALEQAADSGDPLSIATARHALAVCDDAPSRPLHIQAALAALTSGDLESTDLRLLLLANYVVQLTDLGRPREGERVLAEAVRVADRSGTFRGATILAGAAGFAYRHGRWDDALVHIAGIETEYFGNDELAYAYANAALIYLHRGDRETADKYLEYACGPGQSPSTYEPPAPSYPLTEALAVRAEADGDVKRALSLMSGWLEAPLGLSRHERHDDLPYLVHLAMAVGDPETARAATRLAEQDAAVDPSPSRVNAARGCRAMLEDDADEMLAVSRSQQHYEWTVYAAYGFEWTAVSLAASGDTVRARAALTDAVRLYTDLGAVWDVKRADSRLRAHGVRRGPRAIHRKATTGWEALTPSEQRIAELVARGRSNPDIAAELYLSRRTVQTHVSNILAKLQLSSRIDVIRAAQQRATAAAAR